VSERNEHSYYEISLTGAQMVIGFAVLLGCLLVAFFAGVWLGRGGRAAEQAVVARQEQMQQQEATSKPGQDPASLDQFNFFSDQGQAESQPQQPAKAASGGNAETTLLEDVNGEPAESQTASPAKPSKTSAKPPRTAGRQLQPEAKQEQTAARPAPSKGEEYVIQVFSSNDYAQAQQVLERLRGGDLPAFLSPMVVEGRTMNRVRVGPFPSRDAAESTAAKIRKLYRLDTWITQGG